MTSDFNSKSKETRILEKSHMLLINITELKRKDLV